MAESDVYLKSLDAKGDATIYYHFCDNICVQQAWFWPDKIRHYTIDKPDGDYGGLCDQPLTEFGSGWEEDFITKEEFDLAWKKALES